jgi:hypothetical protein
MEKVLSITSRLQDKKRKEQVREYRDRFEAVQRVLQCSGCQYKCAMCNRHIDQSEPSDSPPASLMEFTLCDSCRFEYEAFMQASQKGEVESDIFWHNTEWIELWTCWINYQRSINKFRSSFNFTNIKE